MGVCGSGESSLVWSGPVCDGNVIEWNTMGKGASTQVESDTLESKGEVL